MRDRVGRRLLFPGSLLSGGLNKLLFARNGPGTTFLMRGTRYVSRIVLTYVLCSAPAFALELSKSADHPEVVFSYKRDRCAPTNVPDAPARAFQDASGTVHLFAAHIHNRALIGPSLNNVKIDCGVTFQGSGDPQPDAFNGWNWLTAFYTSDGIKVSALVHGEYHGERHTRMCDTKNPWSCWYNTVTNAISTDQGYTFTSKPAPANLVAAVPEPYRSNQASRVGVFSPTNILEWEKYFYSFIIFEDSQVRGICVMRTDNPFDASSWRAWDGQDFSVQFVDPFRGSIEDPSAHRCKPLDRLIPNTIGSVVRHEKTNTFIAIQTTPGNSRLGGGVYFSTSSDLVNWSAPVLLLDIPVFDHFECPIDSYSYGYGSLLDPDSGSRIFDTVGDNAYLYLTRFKLKNCKRSIERDLVRLPVQLGSGPKAIRHNK